jgi:DNA-binding transcriptional MocR family regulator
MSIRLADAIRDAIDRGILRCGTRLPPERDLAFELIVSRGTVSAAYQQLRDDGLVETRGRGRTAVLAPEGYRAFTTAQADFTEPNSGPLIRSLGEPPGRMVDFATAPSRPLPGLGARMQALFANFESHPISRMTYVSMGMFSLRDRIAQMYSRSGCPTSVENILITSGAQQALSLVLQLTISAGDMVLCEDPSYPGAVQLLRALFARTHSISLDDEGLSYNDLAHITGRSAPKMLFFSPSFNSPTGRMTSLERRMRIVAHCAQLGLPIVEDNSLVDLNLTEHALAGVPQSLSAFNADAPIFSIGSVDKSVWTGLRVGWLRAPTRHVRRLMELKAFTDMTTSLPSQWIAEQFLDDQEAFAQRRQDLRLKLRFFQETLQKSLPEWRYERPDGGQSLWVDIGISASRFAQAAERCGVRVGAGHDFSVSDEWKNYLRLPFGQLDSQEIIDGVERLQRAFETAQGHNLAAKS